MNKLNVCLLNDSFPPYHDGVAVAVCNYARNIVKNHGSATVVTPSDPNARDGDYPFPIVRYPSVDTTRLIGYRAGLPFSSETLETLERSRFDLMHSHCPVVSTLFARLLRSRIGAPIVFTYHTKFDIDIETAFRGKLLQKEAIRCIAKNVSACDEVWTVSRGAGENLRALGYEGDYIVMPNGVDFPSGRVSDAEIAAASEGVDLPEGVPVFLFAGRMMWYKGVRIILDALARLSAQGQDFRMVFLGEGANKDEIVRYAQELSLLQKVIFLPFLHDRKLLRAWYCRADLFLFPSSYDTNGLVVREAAACALPSMLIAGSCAAEDFTDGHNGYLIDESAEAMASALSRLCQERDAMRRAGEHAQKEVYLSWEDAVARAYDRYQVVLENWKRGVRPAVERPSDDFLRAMAALMHVQSSLRARTEAVRQDVLRRFGREK